jgi:quercetin dioxygenase-like cupin family protein
MITRIVLQAGIVAVLLGALMSDISSPSGFAAGFGSSEADLGINEFAMQRGRGQVSHPDGSLACLLPAADASEYTTPTPNQRLTAGIPDGVSLTPLAAGMVAELPLLPAKLTLARQDFQPGAEVPPTTATGPILFIIERGTLTIFLSGNDEHYGPGSSALVQVGQRYSLVNEGGISATLLRLAVDKLSALDAPVMRIEPVTQVPGSSALRPVSSRLFQATIDRLPRLSALLFVGCVSWVAPPNEVVVHRHPGAVALRMVSGSLQIDDGLMMGSGGCRLFDGFVPYQIRPGNDLPTAFLFGVIAENQQLWLAADDATLPSGTSSSRAANVSCG